ncbi:MAG: glycosyltransferase family 4 protein [Actinomycetota bacterium]
MGRPLRIAIASYRAHPEVGGQGVYVTNLAAALRDLGHDVTIFAGPPYPLIPDGVHLETVPSLDLYRPSDPFRRPSAGEFHNPIDALEYAIMCTGAFPEPMTFSLRFARLMKHRQDDFDVVHDNQCLGYGMLTVAKRLPLVTTIHHPISIDRRLALQAAPTRAKRMAQKRWYSFVAMQRRVAKRLPSIVTVSRSARDDIVREFGVAPERVEVIHNGVDLELFRPLPHIDKRPGLLLTVASSSQPSKGLDHLLEAVAKLRTERPEVRLVVIGKGGREPSFARAVERFDLGGHVEAHGRVDTLRMVELLAAAEVAVVPSLYEGFSLPAIEAMSCGLPVVATTGGALREVIGEAGITVPPGDAGALAAAAGKLLDDVTARRRLGEMGRQRVLERFTWRSTAEHLVDSYREVMRLADR